MYMYNVYQSAFAFYNKSSLASYMYMEKLVMVGPDTCTSISHMLAYDWILKDTKTAAFIHVQLS